MDDDFILSIERLPIPAEEREFLIKVRRQYLAELAQRRHDEPDTPPASEPPTA
jgi:hypothetical protein